MGFQHRDPKLGKLPTRNKAKVAVKSMDLDIKIQWQRVWVGVMQTTLMDVGLRGLMLNYLML